MNGTARTNLILGLCIIAFAALLLGLWIPQDVQTGIVEKVRRQVTIGDALAPTVAGLFLLIGGAMLLLVERNDPTQPRLDARNLRFAAAALVVVLLSLALMRYAGPVAVALRNLGADQPAEYRLLRDDVPWKYIGFALGGWTMVAGLVTLVEGRLTARIALVAALAVLAMIAIYDLPFDDLLLPPNGDV